MSSKRTVQARKSLAEVSTHMADSQKMGASFIPAQQVRRGVIPSAPLAQMRGTGRSKFLIPDACMLYRNNPQSNVIDNTKCGLSISSKRWRCNWCFCGPYTNLTDHRKTCRNQRNPAAVAAAKARASASGAKIQQSMSSILRFPPSKARKTTTSSYPSSGASSSSSSSNSASSSVSSDAPVASDRPLSWKDHAISLARKLAKPLIAPYRNRNVKPETKRNSSSYKPIPKSFEESYISHGRPPKMRGLTRGDHPIEYILTGDRVQWHPELSFNDGMPWEDKPEERCLLCRCGGKLRTRGDIHCTTISLKGPGILTSKHYTCQNCNKHWNGWDRGGSYKNVAADVS